MARKSPAEKIQRIRKVIQTWEEMAPGSVFYGMTLKQFKKKVRPCETLREGIADLRRRLSDDTDRRNDADDTAMQLLEGISNGVQGDPKFGRDSLLYGRLGYVRKSARRKRRKKR